MRPELKRVSRQIEPGPAQAPDLDFALFSPRLRGSICHGQKELRFEETLRR